MEIEYTDLGVIYTVGENTVTIEGDWDCSEVWVNNTHVGESKRWGADALFESTDGSVQVIGSSEADFEQFALRLCKQFA